MIGITIPVISLINNAAIKRAATSTVMNVTIAMRSYADEDPRRFFPPQDTNRFLIYDTANSSSTLALLETYGYKVPFPELDTDSSGTARNLVDGWGQPIFYQIDGPYRNAGVLDTHLMNGTADKPATLADWNPKGDEPFAYVWSLGRPLSGASATVPDPSKTTNWIYPKGTP